MAPEIEPATVPPAVPPTVQRDTSGRFVPGSGRPPARRRGGRPGNLNAARPHNMARLVWRRGLARLPADLRWIAAATADYVEALRSDLGGDLSHAEERIATLARTAAAAGMLAQHVAAQEPVRQTDDGPALSLALAEVARFAALEASMLDKLGLKRRARTVTLAQHLAARATQPEAAGATQAPHTGAE